MIAINTARKIVSCCHCYDFRPLEVVMTGLGGIGEAQCNSQVCSDAPHRSIAQPLKPNGRLQ
jgi:hypothetical protein